MKFLEIDLRRIDITWGDMPDHGGDIDWAARRFGIPVGDWIDLSTGINPWPYSASPPPPDAWTRLPGHAAETALLEAARKAYGIAAEAACVAAPGTQAMIQLLPRLRAAGAEVAILSPTYGEHEAAWRAAGHRVRAVASLAEIGAAEVVVIVNPNNPDGRVVAPETVLSLAGDLASRGGLLIVDEAFADAMPEVSVTGRCDRPGLIVLRSFGKFFGLAGARLGFAIGDRTVCDALRARLGPWAVSGPTLAVGAAALGDVPWREAMRGRLIAAAGRLDAVLTGGGLAVVGGTPLFRLARADDAFGVFNALANNGILVRAFAARRDVLRFGLPGDDAASARLEEALDVAGLQPVS